ncbi:unnamed protein product [Rhizoctonia solani]|uniref:DUF3835 domain-containing protein n=1 Tax=Rhizoctonia solani TaxID=456999 RepID=A0A8H3DVX1_9AGAM|nr:unnamed protein product [Rhizoctonia solani]
MEIMEPVTNTNESSLDITSSSLSVLGQAPLSPLPNWALSPAALAARRRERDRILDLLEQEEEAEFAREAAATHEPTNRSSATVPVTPPYTLDQAFRTPNPNSSSPSESVPISSGNREGSRPSGDLVDPTRKPKKQKSVSFVDPSKDRDDPHQTPRPDLDWGDVIPVRLDSSRPGPAKGRGVMKELVVERPAIQSGVVADRIVDSDDEDDKDDEDEELNQVHDVPEEEDSETEVPKEALGQLETSDNESDMDREGMTPSIEFDDTDFDEAMLQREIALAYYARRNQIGVDISSGPLFDSTSVGWDASRDEEQDGSTRGIEVMCPMPFVSAPANIEYPKSNSTRFRGSRLPGDPQVLINSAVQFGRLVDGELVVSDTADREVEASIASLTGSSDIGQEDMTEKMIEMLRRGDKTVSNPTTTETTPSIEQIPNETFTLGSRSSVSESRPPPSAKQQNTAHISKPRSKPVPASANHKPQRPTIPPPPTNDRPMIIESGFGFDPAFQVAPPPKPSATKAPAPLSGIVKERVTTASIIGPEKKRSRFAQARASVQLPVPQRATPFPTSVRVKDPTTISSDIVERTSSPSSVPSPPGPPKRMSRFRAERSGWM